MDIRNSALYLGTLIIAWICFMTLGHMTNFWMVIWAVVLLSAIGQTILYYNHKAEFRASAKDCVELVTVPVFMLLMLKNASKTEVTQLAQLLMLVYFVVKLLLMALFSAWRPKSRGVL